VTDSYKGWTSIIPLAALLFQYLFIRELLTDFSYLNQILKGKNRFETMGNNYKYQLAASFLAFFFCSISLFSQSVVFNELVSSNSQSLLDEDGDSPDWIELYNPGSSALDLSGYWLSDDKAQLLKWTFPSIDLPSHGFLVVFASGKDRDHRHTNFKISSGGETLFLSNPGGILVDSVDLPALPSDVSYGRQPDGGVNWFYFLTPTPGSVNDRTAWDTPDPLLVGFSPEGGLYPGSLSLTLSTNLPESEIYYTIDGSVPDEGSALATGPLVLDTTTVVRARVLSNAVLSDLTTTHSYVIDKETELPVISIAAIPDDLWNSNTGIYENYESEEEIPVHIEFFTPDGLTGFSQDAGMKIFGGWSRTYPQKSFALFARSAYGVSSINYPLFTDQPFTKYESFILRNSGGDYGVTHVADAVMQQLISSLDLETQAYQPVVVYLNGVYWGILNMREKISEHYIEAHHGIEEADLDMLENQQELIHGDANHYNALLDYIESEDMTLAQSYIHIKNQIDLDDYLDYMVSELYLANVDWPGWNLKYWRPRTTDGKWRWIVYDLDGGFGGATPELHGYDNMFDFATATDGVEWPNPPWSTLLFRKLLENEAFFEDFINRYADYLNTIWQPELVSQKIDLIQEEIDIEMISHLERWNFSYSDWQDAMNLLHEFSDTRVDEVRSNALSEFSLSGLADLDIHIEPAGSGAVHLNSCLTIYDAEWHGSYFLDIPVNVEALVRPGYKFIGWDVGGSTETSSSLELPLSDNTILTANFAPGGDLNPIVINEINYHSVINFDPGDWIELYNNSDDAVDVSGWKFKDATQELVLPDGVSIAAHEYLVLCQDLNDFQTLFPGVPIIMKAFDFGLSNGGEHISLLDSYGQYADSLTYGDSNPWPATADGQGATLELKDPFSDNSLAQNWMASDNYGTPGAVNTGTTHIPDRPQEQELGSFTGLSNYPNPFNYKTNISFNIPKAGQVQVRVYDMMGRVVSSLYDGNLDQGKQQFEWQPDAQLQPGVYFCKVQFNQQSQSVLMVLVR
jgi:hypothetical protein